MIKLSVAKFPIGFPAKTLADNGGKHIYSVTCKTEELPNGVFVGKGAFIDLDQYAVAAAGSVAGSIVGKTPNGNYWVEITSCDEGTLFLSNVPMIEEEWGVAIQNEENYVNAKDTEIRAYQLAPGDIIELNKAALGLSNDPSSYPVSVSSTTYASSSYAVALN